jgi:hypothetical protein
MTASSLTNLGLVATDCGDYERAAALQQEALVLQVTFGNMYGLADCFENIAHNAVEVQRDRWAAQLFAVAETLRARIGAPSDPSDRGYNQRRIQVSRERLGETVFTSVWNAGLAMSLDEAITLALNDPSLQSMSDPPFIVDAVGFEPESV